MLEVGLDNNAFEKMVHPKWRKQVPFAMAHALTRTAIAGKAEQQEAMNTQITGGGTRWTRDGVRYKRATKRRLESLVYYARDRPYMRAIIDGGVVVAKKKKLSEPVNVRTDKYGNIPSGRGKNKYTARAKGDPKFFLGIPKGRTGENYRGVWRRYGKGGLSKSGKPRGKIKLMVSWARSQRNQRPTFDAYGVAEKHAGPYLRRQAKASIRFAIKTAK